MKNKIGILSITLVLTIIVFSISTYMQKQLIDYEPKINCLVLNQDVDANQKLEAEMFALKGVPISLISTAQVVTSFSEIEGMYAKDNIYKSQIAMRNQFDTKENLSIYEAENGKEKISIKIQNAENGVSYAIKQNSLVNVYATVRSDYAKNFLVNNERLTVGDEYDGYTVIKLLDSTQVLGTFNIDGIEVNGYEDGIIDSIMVAVTPDEAKQINLLRDIATFNITGISNQYVEDEEV
ncbi:MAG: hypothetical protein IJX99_08055 [Clostridia bacterium]|nr:hypothetical protein [Clostridia bacterium]